MTALMMAALKGNTANIHSLLAQNADGNLRNILGQSALDIAIAMGHEEVAEILLSDNRNVNNQVPDLSTEITVREMGGSKTYMLTEVTEACTTQSEEPSLQLCDFTENTEISQNLYLLDRPSQYLAGPQLQFSADLDDVAASNKSTSFSHQSDNMTPKACSPKIEYCISCCKHHPPDISQCLKKKFSTFTKSDTLLPVHTTCQLDSIIRKPQSETEGAVELLRHKPSLSGRKRLTRFLSAIKQALKFKRNVHRSFNTSQDYSVRCRTGSPSSIKHTESSGDTALSPLRNLDFRHSNLEVSRLPSRILSPHISTQTGRNKTQAYRSRAIVTSPQSNTGISHSRTHDYNWTYRGLSPHTKTHVLKNSCQTSTQTRGNYMLEESYKIGNIPCNLCHTSVATQEFFFHNDRQHIYSHKQNTHAEYSRKNTYRLPNTEFSSLSNIDTNTLSSRTHSPLSNTKTDSLPDTASSSFSNTEPYRLSFPSSMDIHRTLSAPSHNETYSLADTAFPSQGNSYTDHNKTQMDTILNRAHSPITNLDAYSSSDRVHSPIDNSQTYRSGDRVHSPAANLQMYSLADRVHSPIASLKAYSSAERVYSSVANLQTDSSVDRVHFPVANLYTYSSADGVHSPVANLKTSAARVHSPVANLHTYSSAYRVHSPVANLHTYSSADRVHSPVANLHTYSSAERVHSPVANLHTYSSADRVHSPVANLQAYSSADRVSSPLANLHTYSSADRVHSSVANLKAYSSVDQVHSPVANLQFTRQSMSSCS